MCYNDCSKKEQKRKLEQNFKYNLSTDCRLQLAYMKSESLVIVDQHATVNILGVLYTPPVTSGE